MLYCDWCVICGTDKRANFPPLKTIHHNISISLYPEKHSFIAEDTITLSADHPSELYFRLHKGLNPSVSTKGVLLTKGTGEAENVLFETYRVTFPEGVTIFTLRYGGIIDHPVMQYGKEQARGFSNTPGLIWRKGCIGGKFLLVSVFDVPLVTFRLDATLPSEWDVVSQGQRVLHDKDGRRRMCTGNRPETPGGNIYLQPQSLLSTPNPREMSRPWSFCARLIRACR